MWHSIKYFLCTIYLFLGFFITLSTEVEPSVLKEENNNDTIDTIPSLNNTLDTTADSNITTIKILIKKPKALEIQYSKENLEKLSQYFVEQNVENPLLKNVRIEFGYCLKEKEMKEEFQTKTDEEFIQEATHKIQNTQELEDKGKRQEEQEESAQSIYLKDSEYVNYIKCIAKQVKESEFDMLILDDHFLFSDDAFVENIHIEKLFKFRKLHRNYLDLYPFLDRPNPSDAYVSRDISFHDGAILRDGQLKYDKGFYGLPYELDFDVLYYHPDQASEEPEEAADADAAAFLKDFPLEHRFWDDLLEMDQEAPEDLTPDSATSTSTAQLKKILVKKEEDRSLSSTLQKHTLRKGEGKGIVEMVNPSLDQEQPEEEDEAGAQRAKPSFHRQKEGKEGEAEAKRTKLSLNRPKEEKEVKETNPSSTSSNLDTSPHYVAPLSIPLNDRNELLNFFIEYVSDRYNLTMANRKRTKDYQNYFYDKSSNQLYQDFQNFVAHCSGLNITEILKAGTRGSYQSFLNKETRYFKGKASYYPLLQSSNVTFSTTLPPHSFSVISEKFLVINTHSTKDKEILVEAAFQLTSKPMQLFRAQYLNSIPTFNITKKEEDPEVGVYCTLHPQVCEALMRMEPIRVKEIFRKDKFSVTFMEIRLLLPRTIRNFLNSNQIKPLHNAFTNIMEVKIFSFVHPDGYVIGLYTIMALFVAFLGTVILYIYKHRKHPHLKVVSPTFCILTIIGLISNTFTPVLLTHISSSFICKFIYVQGILSRTLIFIPLFSVIFRIYCIYNHNSSVNFGKKLNDRRLLCFIGLVLLVAFSVSLFIVFKKEFYIITLGDINKQRYLKCYHNGTVVHIILGVIYYLMIFIGMIIMIVKSGKMSKRLDEIKIIFLIILILAGAVLVEIVMIYSPVTIFSKAFFAICFFYIIICAISVHLLIGSRLLFIMKHPQSPTTSSPTDEGSSTYYHEYYNTIRLSDFIDRKQIKNHPAFSHFSNPMDPTKKPRKSYQERVHASTIDQNDPIANNPNNYFFNQSLELLNQPSFNPNNR